MTDMTLRELLSDLSRDPAAQAEFEADPDGYLSAHGFELSPELLGEAIVNVAATLPAEVAEHLAPFTISQSPIPRIDEANDDPGGPDGSEGAAGLGAMGGLGLLASAPTVVEELTEIDGGIDEAELSGFGEGSADGAASPGDAAATTTADRPFDDGADLEVDDAGLLHVDDTDGGDGPGLFDLDDEGGSLDGADDGSVETADAVDTRDPADLDDLDGFE
jgi:hypothetical protein